MWIKCKVLISKLMIAMNNNLLLSLAISVIPILAIVFVGLLVLYKIYVKIRSKFNVSVNCWFCNQNAKVPYIEYNSWTCPHCEQYNGFTKDGDYNREIFQQLDCSNASSMRHNYSGSSSEIFARPPLPPRNGFCNICNEAQRLKVEKLAQFEPKNESHFDDELKIYKAKLEEQYRLCSTCDRHLNKVLREKKKMVLGSKFLDFIIKGAETFKQPHFNQIRHAKQQDRKHKFTLLIGVLAVVNICCLFDVLPKLTREHLIQILGTTLGTQLFIACSHMMALVRVFATYFEGFTNHAIVLKIMLFFRTLLMMALYSLGLKLPQIARINFGSLYVLACPFAILSLAFGHNIIDRFRLTRYTFLLVLWSTFAGGLIEDQFMLSQNILMFIASLLTIVLTATGKVEASPKLHDNTANSFHKIYSEEYLSDEETISMLSQQLNCSSSSMRSVGSTNRSFHAPPSSPSLLANQHNHTSARFTKSPLTSSVFSLNNLPHQRTQLSPNSSFKSFCIDDAQSMRSPYAASMCNMPRSTLFASNLELSSRDRPQSSVFGLSGNPKAPVNNSFVEPHAYQQRMQQRSDDNFSNPARTNIFGGGAHVGDRHDTLIHSPYSVSSTAVYQQQRAQNLLCPSRFSTNCLASNASAGSWLSGGYFNQQRQSLAAETPRSNFLHEHRNGGMTAIDENLSRASSQSSGFESQNGRLNLSRENSFCTDAVDLQQRTTTLDNTRASAAVASFQPIEPNYAGSFSPRPSLFSNSNLMQPLSVNCSTTSTVAQSELWKPSPAMRRRDISGRDSFNLRKINEELPTIKRGDLLKKWKESQAIS